MRLVSNWYGLEILPLYLLLSEEKMQAAQEQLEKLKIGNIPTESILKRIIKFHEQQNKTTWVVIEQCERWRKQQPNKNQIADIIRLKENTKALEKTNEQILDLAKKLPNNDDYCSSKHEVRMVLNSMLIAHGWE